MAKRQDLVKAWTDWLGDDWFAYAGYRERPNHLPYGLYIEIPRPPIMADDIQWVKIRRFVFRLVTAEKDWEMEEKAESIFDALELHYCKVTDEPVSDEKDHMVEWEVEVIG